MELSNEQKLFIEEVKNGSNVLVDACIGSGKTTAIQHLCDALPEHLKILYLTYNKLLKVDAKSKIHNRNVTVTNYHGFAYMMLARAGVKSVGISDLIQLYNKTKPQSKYDVLIIDEYQDIEQELAEMLEIIKAQNPGIQLVAVGDMKQKIYDKTTLRIDEFIQKFMGDHKTLEFTQCFRLSNNYAKYIGDIWEKKIVGVNNGQTVSEMSKKEVVRYLSQQNPSDVICLGSRTGDMAEVLNELEKTCPQKYNKQTIYASIVDSGERAVEPTATSGIFTTYDSSKGLERKICVVFDYTYDYWYVRLHKPQQSFQILKNIFMVAISRGKEQVIFVRGRSKDKLEPTDFVDDRRGGSIFLDMNISTMFDFKYKEDIEECYRLLDVKEIERKDKSVIEIEGKDGLIDLSPCIGIYQEARYFKKYDLDKAIQMQQDLAANNRQKSADELTGEILSQTEHYKDEKQVKEQKILQLTALETKQWRYISQVSIPFVTPEADKLIIDRLATEFTPDEDEQTHCQIVFTNGRKEFVALGLCDVIKDNTVYELKFVSDLQHVHFLQTAVYMVALKLEKGILWNTRNNTMYEIHIPNKKRFMDAVTRCITKGEFQEYHGDLVSDRHNNTPIKHTAPTIEQPVEMAVLVKDDRVRHKKFGDGTVLELNEDQVTVLFDTGENRRRKFKYPTQHLQKIA